MAFSVSYVSAACNHVPGVLDWGNNNLIAYGSCNAVLIYNPHLGGGIITNTLSKHSARVNSVRWIQGSDFETELVSCSADKRAVVWTLKNNKYECTVLEEHEDVVTLVDGLYKNVEKKHVIVVSAAADCKMKVWERTNKDGDFVLKQNISHGYNICTALRLFLCPENNELILACGNNRSQILLYTEEKEKFIERCALKGHEDWVRGLDFTAKDHCILLASSSQDNFVRIWRFAPQSSNDEISGDILKLGQVHYEILLETVLSGHDGWIYSVNWSNSNAKLLSASLDKSLIIWEYNEDAEMWMEADRVGGIGGNTLGFYGGVFSKDGNCILGHGYHGALHLWRYNEENFSWEPQVTVGGHFRDVTDLAWDPLGNYIMTVSNDQTTRIHAPWKKSPESPTTWHEIARPQVHGFDIGCLALIDHYRFASGADEKIVRTFQAPRNFVENFERICQVSDESDYVAPKGASVPSLGLSNKAIFQNDNAEQTKLKSKKDFYPEESHFTATFLTEPPTEENLMQNTLWPEVQKLYGHGYEVYALAASPDGKLLASSCKATTADHAAIILWEAQTWQIVQRLLSHTLTIAQLSFSPDSQHILSVSRDRRWSLFTKNATTNLFDLEATTGNNRKTAIHARIIWCCAWTDDSRYFATGSRDGKVVVWVRGEEETQTSLGRNKPASAFLELSKESVTALAFAERQFENWYLLAVGLDSGFIILYKWSPDFGFEKVLTLDNNSAHHLTVKRLAFRPIKKSLEMTKGEKSYQCQLASCSADFSLRIYDIDQRSFEK